MEQIFNRDFNTEFIFQTSRSGGAGGQNVNKVSTKVELKFHVDGSALLSEEEKTLLKIKFANQITQEGFLQIVSQTERTQLGNKEQVIKKFYKILQKAFLNPKSVKKPNRQPAKLPEELQKKRK